MANKQDPLKHESDYIAFLEKRVASENYRRNVTPEEYEQTKEKLKRARFKFKVLKGK